MRKVLAAAMALLLSLALAACAGGTNGQDGSGVSQGNADSSAPGDSAQTASETGEPQDESSGESGSTQPAASEPAASGEPDGIASAADATATSDTQPVPLGQWAKTARYATEDKTYHTVYVRVNRVTTSTADAAYIQSAVALHNASSSDFMQIDVNEMELPDDVELCVVDYEVYVPADFPAPDYGIVEPTMSFSQSNIGGGGIPSADGTSTYVGLGSNTEELAMEEDPTYQPGNTYAFRSLFTMVKGYTDYVLEFTSYPDGTKETSADVMYHAYFANK